MSAFSSHETFFKNPSQHSQPNFSSFIKKSTTSTQKSQLLPPSHSRGKSNSNSIKSSPKSLQKPHLTKSHLSNSPPTKNNKIFLDVQPEQSSHYRLQEHSITNSKKSSNNNTQDVSKDQSKDISQASYTSETLSNPLDRFTFYNSNFSLFDTKSNSTTTRHALESPHSKTSQLAQFTSQKAMKEAINVQERLEIISKVIGEQKKQQSSNSNSPTKKSPTKTEKAIKAHKMDLSPSSPAHMIKLQQQQRPETTKHIGNSHSMSLQNHGGTVTGNFFGQNKQPAKKTGVGVGNFVTSTQSPSKSMKSPINNKVNNNQNLHPVQQQHNIEVDYLEEEEDEEEEEEEEKRESDQTDPYMLKSTSLVGGSGLFRSGVMSQMSNNSGLIKKNPLMDNTSSEYGKYNKIYKGIENKSSYKFAPERYKRLGKGNIEENNSIPIAPGESGLLSQKASYKAQRRMKGTFLSHGDMNFFMQSPTKKNENVNSIGNVDSITNRDNINRRDDNEGGMMTAKETDIQTLNSLGQISGSYNDVDINSGVSVHLASGNGSLKESDLTEKTIEMGKEHARNEEFERFFNDAMNYMCELVDGRIKNNAKEHEEQVAGLLDSIVKEMNSLKTGHFEVFEKVATGKRLLVLLDMALKSVACVAKKKDLAMKKSFNRSSSGKLSDKKSLGLQVRFEDIYGLEPGQGIYEENEKTMREKLCKEIEKRRGELEELERLLRETKEVKMLQYVQVAKGKVNNALSSLSSMSASLKNKKKTFGVGK